ncbi:MAG: periplasmic heavy metal sensor [Pikeienuella sp.]
MSPTPSDAPKRSLRTAPRWVKWTLGISLCLNLIVLGGAIGAAAKYHGRGHDLGAMTMNFALKKMSRDSRSAAEVAIAANRPAMRAARRANGEARGRLADVVSAPVFDPAAAEAAFADILTAKHESRRLVHKNFVAILAAMTDEERAEAAKHLLRWERWRKRGARE